MAPITFGSFTMPTSIPRGLRTSGDTGIGMVNQLNSTWNTGEVGPTGAGQGTPTLTADVAADYKGIRANMQQDQGGGFHPIRALANLIINKKLDNAV